MRFKILSATSFIILTFTFGIQAGIWSSIESQHFLVMYTESERAARNVQRIAEDFYPEITKDMGYSTERKITIWFCESLREFNRAVNAPIQDWAAGCAYPQHARVVILDPKHQQNKNISLSQLLKHEITHVIFGLYAGGNLEHVPRWFNEGVAMFEAGESTYSQNWTMLTGSLSKSLIPLDELEEDFPQNESQARLAYAQSYSIVAFMVRKYGIDSLRTCVALLAEGREMEEAMAGAVGFDTTWLERKWLRDLKKQYKWISLISSWVVLWGLVVLIAVLAYWRRKVKNRRIIQQWEEEEALWPVLDEPDEDEDDGSVTWTYRW